MPFDSIHKIVDHSNMTGLRIKRGSSVQTIITCGTFIFFSDGPHSPDSDQEASANHYLPADLGEPVKVLNSV